MRRTLALAALLGLVVTGCTSSVDGSGALDGSVPTGGPTPAPSGQPSTPAGARTALSCEGAEVIEPSGAPYCYLVPPGLVVMDELDLPGAGMYTSAVGIGGRDVIAVTVFDVGTDTDPLPDSQLQAAADTLVEDTLTAHFDFASTEGEALTVDNARALKYTGTAKPTDEDPDPFTVDFYFIYRGTANLQVNCQYQNNQAELSQGCQELLDSLQFKRTG